MSGVEAVDVERRAEVKTGETVVTTFRGAVAGVDATNGDVTAVPAAWLDADAMDDGNRVATDDTSG